MLRSMDADLHASDSRIVLTPGADLKAVDVEVPGDFSSAAFWLVLGCLHPAAEVRAENVGLNPSRTGLLTILERMGVDIEVLHKREVAGEPVADLVVRSSRLRG